MLNVVYSETYSNITEKSPILFQSNCFACWKWLRKVTKQPDVKNMTCIYILLLFTTWKFLWTVVSSAIVLMQNSYCRTHSATQHTNGFIVLFKYNHDWFPQRISKKYQDWITFTVVNVIQFIISFLCCSFINNFLEQS